MIRTLLVTWLVGVGAAAHADTRWSIVIGNDRGRATEGELRYAEDDARKFHALLRELGGVQAENALLLLGEDAETVRRALVAVNDRIRQGDPAASTLVVYYSGHADEGALHLGETALQLAELESLVRGSSAAFRLVVLDACRSGALTRVKGGVIGPPVPVKRTIGERAPADGVVFLTASARDEDAQESDRIRGSFFTHYLVSGLRGAADHDGDGDVDLEEAYGFAYERTLRASSDSAVGPQHPTYRHEMRGRSEVVLTRPGSAANQALLVLPPAVTWFVFAGDVNGSLLAEVQADAPNRVIALRAQRLFVRGRAKDALLEASFEVRAGERTDVGTLPLTKSRYARLVRKGGGMAATNGLELGYRLTSPLETDGSLAHGLWLGLAHDREELSIDARLGIGWGGYRATQPSGAVLEADARIVEASLGLHKAFDVALGAVEIGGDVGLAWLHQSFDWVGSAPDRDSLAGRLAASAAWVVDVTGAAYLRFEGAVMLWLFERDDDGVRLTPVFAPRFEVGFGWHL